MQKIIDEDLSAAQLSVQGAQKYLALNGVDWSVGWIWTQIKFGAIQSAKVFSSRVVIRKDLDRVIREHKAKEAQA